MIVTRIKAELSALTRSYRASSYHTIEVNIRFVSEHFYVRFIVVDSSCSYPFFIYKEEGRTISDLMINEQIRDKEVRVIGPDGEQLGIMSAKEAYFKAKDSGLDLVKIAPTATPPVCKIIDYGKYRYEQSRKAKEAKKKQRIVETKEIRLSPNIDVNDLNTKANQARKFLTKG